MAKGIDRRKLLGGAIAGSALLAEATPATAKTISGKVPWEQGEAAKPPVLDARLTTFLTSDEAAFLDAACERLIPTDSRGVGARDAGVTAFLDRQLAGGYGRGDRWYMQGPWAKGAPTQGYQERRAPADLYRAAIAAIDKHLLANGGKPFAALAPEAQDAFLTRLEKGDVPLENSVDAKMFFDLLLQNTLEGFFSDPIYGGNRNMAGWAMIGFPGAHYDYREFVAKPGERVPTPPVSIKGRPGWNPNT